MSEELKKKKVNPRRLQGTTNFYPTYVDGNKDKVTPVGAARRTDFQTVLPRYTPVSYTHLTLPTSDLV